MSWRVMVAASAFLNPALLGGLGLVLAPILIHLLFRRRFRRVAWGATRFLMEAERVNRRRVRFEQWLLLALRCLAMALLALLVARPFVQPGVVASLLGAGGGASRIIVLDDSLSLSNAPDGVPDFVRLRDAVSRLLSWIHQEAPADEVTVLRTSRPDNPLLARAQLTDTALADFLGRLGALSGSDLAGAPRDALRKVASLVAERATRERAEIYVFSDFQRVQWTPEPSGAESVFAPLRDFDDGQARVTLVGFGSEARPNYALSDLRLERPQTIAGMPAIARARVWNYSPAPLRDARVNVTVAGAALPATPIDPIGPGEYRLISFEVVCPEPGMVEITASLDVSDALQADNVRRIAAQVRPALRVLLVNGAPSGAVARDEVHFARSALSPSGMLASGIEVETITADELEAADLSRFDSVWLCNVPAPRDADSAALRRFVHKGGGLAIFPGDQVDPAEYNRVLGDQGAGLLPVRLGEPVDRREPGARIAIARVAEHPVVAMFSTDGAAMAEYVRFWRYFRLEAPLGASQPSAAVLARFTDAEQAPALVEGDVGPGRVLLFAFPADLDWSDWPRAVDGSYVVTLLETAQWLARRSSMPADFVAGERLGLQVPTEEYRSEVTFRAPSTAGAPPVAAQLRVMPGVSEHAQVDGPLATVVGTYEAELTPRLAGAPEVWPLCVNCDPAESALAAAQDAELDAALGPLSHVIVRASESFLSAEERSRRELWPASLALLFAVLMIEQFLAWWFGRVDRPARQRTAQVAR